MSFSFNFASNELNEDDREEVKGAEKKVEVDKIKKNENDLKGSSSSPSSKKGITKTHSLESLMTSLPSKLSFTRIKVPIPQSDRSLSLYRRDLFDARFQMLHEDDEDEGEMQKDGANNDDWKAVMAGAATDLIPGVYEGGLKTWECSIDLAGLLAQRISEFPDLLKNKKVIELGCGTAIPSCYLFSNAFTHQTGSEKLNLTLQLCDFNEQVLRMVTLPNLLLNWYFTHQEHQVDSVNSSDQGEVELSDEIIDNFLDSLKSFGINLQFYSGYWEGLTSAEAFNIHSLPDIILTSETIYSMDTLPILVDTLEEACNGTLEEGLQKAELESKANSNSKGNERLCLVAAKVMYFGVGGGVYAFEQELKRRRAHAEPVWKSDKGVSRVILQIHWRGN